MVDDWFAPLTVLACERDATMSLTFNEIVDHLALGTPCFGKAPFII
jgi:hypothetical protein